MECHLGAAKEWLQGQRWLFSALGEDESSLPLANDAFPLPGEGLFPQPQIPLRSPQWEFVTAGNSSLADTQQH